MINDQGEFIAETKFDSEVTDVVAYLDGLNLDILNVSLEVGTICHKRWELDIKARLEKRPLTPTDFDLRFRPVAELVVTQLVITAISPFFCPVCRK